MDCDMLLVFTASYSTAPLAGNTLFLFPVVSSVHSVLLSEGRFVPFLDQSCGTTVCISTCCKSEKVSLALDTNMCPNEALSV